MKRELNKKGISLIVLIITIVVMIILAAAVMISLTNAGIIGRANEATIASDIAHLKTQVEIIKGDAVLEKLQAGRNLKRQELIDAIQAYYPGSTVNGNIITVEKGKYDIVVDENLNATVVEHGKYTGPTKDIEVTYTTTSVTDGEQINLRIDLLNAPAMRAVNDDSTLTALLNEFLNWLDWEGLLVHAGKMLQPGANLDAETVYTANVESILGVDYNTFKNDYSDTDRNELVKTITGYDTAEILFKNMIAAELDVWTLLTIGTNVLYAQDLLPQLKNKTADEMALIITSWFNNECTIDEITRDVATEQNIEVNTFEEWYAMMSMAFGITDPSAYIFSKEQAMIIVASGAYTATHPIIIEYPDGTEKEYDWWTQTCVIDESYTITQTGNYIIKVTGPSGYVVEQIVALADTTAPTVEIDVINITLNTITIEVTAKESGNLYSGIKEYIYYIKGPNDTDYVLKSKTIDPTYTFEGLTGGAKYEILVGVEDKAGNVGKASINKTLWITAMVDGVPIPKGFVASPYEGERTKDGGLVIYELAANETAIPSSETEHISKTTRNQYVWVSVENFESQFIRQNFDILYTVSNKLGSSYWEVVLNTTTNMPLPSQSSTYMTTTTPNGGITNTLAEVQAMYDSVKTYKGFYIARYEAGLDVGSQKIKDDGVIIKSIHSKMNKAPYNYVRWTYNGEINEDTNGAVEVARSIYPETNAKYGVVSTLTYGVQWDRTLAWWKETKATNGTGDVTIEDNDDLNYSTLYGNYSNNQIQNSTFNEGAQYLLYSQNEGTLATTYADVTANKPASTIWLLTTGATEETRVNNIYDMAGNLDEWTMEGCSTYLRICRGGSFTINGDDNPVSGRADFSPYAGGSFAIGFRPALYIKK